MPTLIVDNVAKQYPTRGEPLEVLRGVSLELDAGRNAAIIGPSGSGKSTLLSIIGSLEKPSAGRIVLDGQDPAGLDEPALAEFRNRRIGFVFQDHYLLPQCSVLENVLVPTVAGGKTTADGCSRTVIPAGPSLNWRTSASRAAGTRCARCGFCGGGKVG